MFADIYQEARKSIVLLQAPDFIIRPREFTNHVQRLFYLCDLRQCGRLVANFSPSPSNIAPTRKSDFYWLI